MVSDARGVQDKAQARPDGPERLTATRLKSVSRNVIGPIALALVSSATISHAQTEGVPAQTAQAVQQPSAPSDGTAPAGDGLRYLNALTFGCVRAGLNAAAREAAKAPSDGAYQFSFFKIIRDGHHSFYEVHFKSNYPGETDLKYCVAIYCQQGWDPKTAQATVTQINEASRARKEAHANRCGDEHAVKRPTKR